jgi:tripartite-type tricarboxylate transporter receptor subunit TctC
VREALQAPDVRKRLQELSASPMGLSPADTATFMKAETERWAAVIRSANVKID